MAMLLVMGPILRTRPAMYISSNMSRIDTVTNEI